MTLAELATLRDGQLATTQDTKAAAEWLGVGYETLLDAARAGTAPVEPIRVGRVYRWPTVQILELLGLGG